MATAAAPHLETLRVTYEGGLILNRFSYIIKTNRRTEMKKKGHKTKPNPLAKVLMHSGYYSHKAEKNKKAYDRKKIAGKRHSGDYSILRAA